MPLQITGRHMPITDAYREYIDKKVARLRRMCPTIDELSFTLTKEKLHIEAEANFRAGRITAQAVVTASQVNEAIDGLVDKLEAQISRTKARRADKKGADKIGQPAEEETDAEVDEIEEELSDEDVVGA